MICTDVDYTKPVFATFTAPFSGFVVLELSDDELSIHMDWLNSLDNIIGALNMTNDVLNKLKIDDVAQVLTVDGNASDREDLEKLADEITERRTSAFDDMIETVKATKTDDDTVTFEGIFNPVTIHARDVFDLNFEAVNAEEPPRNVSAFQLVPKPNLLPYEPEGDWMAFLPSFGLKPGSKLILVDYRKLVDYVVTNKLCEPYDAASFVYAPEAEDVEALLPSAMDFDASLYDLQASGKH